MFCFCFFTISISACQDNFNESITEKPNVDNMSKSNAPNNDILNLFFGSSDYTFFYKAKRNDVEYDAALIVFFEMDTVFTFHIFVDTDQPAYKLMVHEQIIYEAERYLDDAQIRSTDILNAFVTSAKSYINNTSYNPDLLQFFLHFYAILSTAVRSETSSEPCSCLPHPGYFTGAKLFWCQEDYFIDPAIYLEAINSSNFEPSTESKRDLILFLEDHMDESTVPSDQIFSIFESDIQYFSRLNAVFYFENDSNQVRLADCTLGTEIGCCGNYSGCCWLWTIDCLYHDVECLHCDHWYCRWCTPI